MLDPVSPHESFKSEAIQDFHIKVRLKKKEGICEVTVSKGTNSEVTSFEYASLNEADIQARLTKI